MLLTSLRGCQVVALGTLILLTLAQRVPAADDPALAPPVPAAPAPAAPTDDQQPPAPPLAIRFFDVTDLLVKPQDHPFNSGVIPPTQINQDKQFRNGGGGGGGGGLFPAEREQKEPSQAELVEPIVKMLHELVESDSWVENGGMVGRISVVNGTLVVRQTEKNLAECEKLLEQYRKNMQRPLALDAYWVVVNPGELSKLLEAEGSRIVSDAALKKAALYAESHIACQSGQTVHVTSGRAHTVAASASAVVGTGFGMFDPVIEQLLDGMAMQVTPRTGGSTVNVDVCCASAGWERPSELRIDQKGKIIVPATQPTDAALEGHFDTGMAIDRLNIPVQQLATTVSLPLRKACIVGGMTLEPGLTGEGKQLYLVMRATAQ